MSGWLSRPMMRWLIALCAITAIVQTFTAWNWGMPARQSWAVDSVGGMEIVNWVHDGMRYPPGFEGRYTPVHKYLLAGASAPVVGYFWVKNDFGSGEWSTAHVTAYSTALYRAGRMVTIAMAIGVLLLMFTLGRRLGSPEAGLIAAACWIGTYPAMYLTQTTNLDVPYLFWTLFALERLLAYHRTKMIRYLALSAILGGLAVGTKESAAGLIIAFPLLLFWSPLDGATHDLRSGIPKTVRLAVMWGLIALFSYALTCQVFFRPANYLEHLRTITSIADELSIGQGKILMWFFQNLFKSAHPVIHLVFAVGVVSAVLRRRRALLWLLIPVLSYHLVFIVKTQIVGARYILPHLTFLSLLAGVCFADVLSRWPGVRSRIVPGIAVLCFLSGLAMPMVLWADPRQAAEDWLNEHEDARESLATYCHIPAYLPPLAQENARRGAVVDGQPGPVDAEFVISVSTFYQRFLWFEEAGADPVWSRFLAGELDFEPVARFDPKPPPLPWVDITRFRPTMPGFAQTIFVLRRKPDAGSPSGLGMEVPR